MRKKGFTLIELLVVIAIIAMLLAILMPALNKVKQMAMRVICGTNMKGLGTAHMVYAQDYEDQYVVQSGKGPHPWGIETVGWQNNAKNWEDSAATSMLTVGASLYLLVREADVNPKSFVCSASNQEVYDGTNTGGPGGAALDLVELWDFGHIDDGFGPGLCVSYAYHMPYDDTAAGYGACKYAASGTSSASFAFMADKNPWFDRKLTAGGADEDNWPDRVAIMGVYYTPGSSIPKWQILRANSQPHNRDGQNVLFGDGHTEWVKTSDVGVKHDNIYTIWRTATDETKYRVGVGGSADYGVGNNETQPVGSGDSFLVNDDVAG